MRALVLNCTLKPSPAPSNSAALAAVVEEALRGHDVEVVNVRLVDMKIAFGVSDDEGDGDQWPQVRAQVLDSEILILAVPTWLGHPSSLAQLVLERLDALITETDDDGLPLAYNRVAGVVNVGNEDGAHHVVTEIAGALLDIGFTVPAQAWTYWHLGPGPGPDYLDSDQGKDYSSKQARAMAANLVGVARALQAHPLGPPPD